MLGDRQGGIGDINEGLDQSRYRCCRLIFRFSRGVPLVKMEAFYKLFLNQNTSLLNYCSAFKYRYLFFFLLKCYPVQFQNNLTVSLIVLRCARMSGAAFLLPLGESWWGGGRGVVELFTHLILKGGMTTEAESFQALMLCICSAFFFDQWCVLSEMNLSSIVSCLISYVVHCIRPLWRIL